MNAEEESLFEAASRLRDAEKREAFVEEACAGNRELKTRLDALLAAHFAFEGDESIESSEPSDEQVDETALAGMATCESTGQRIGRYKLLERLGEGGFGSVWAAEQTEPVRRRVALKIIKLGMDTKQVVARFEAERQALALMDHPNIAKVLDAGTTENGRPYFAMELVRGVPITEYCGKQKLSPRERLDLFIKVCQALQHAHQKGIIHRDIKPSNILVTLHDGVPVPKIIDFGIAKATQQELTDKTVYTQFQQFIGTPAYMSPEQAEMSGLDIDTRSDIYSLGVLLYELLTGVTPFDSKELLASGVDQMRKIIREREPLKPSTRLSQTFDLRSQPVETPVTGTSGIVVIGFAKDALATLRGDLDWIVMKCLEKDRTRRYETANSLAADLRCHLTDQPVSARPPSALYQFQKTWRRNKVIVSSGIGMAASLIIGLSISLWKTTEANAAKLEADSNQAIAKEQAALAVEEANNARSAEAEAKRLRVEADRRTDYHRRLAYTSDMNQAQQLIEWGNLDEAQEILNHYLPAGGEEDIRGWEWRYLRRECRGDAQEILDELGRGGGYQFSASFDGLWLHLGGFTIGNGYQTRFYNLKTRQESIPSWYQDGDVLMAFSPTEPMAVIARPDVGLCFVSIKSGKLIWKAEEMNQAVPLTEFFKQLRPRERGIGFSRDGSIFALIMNQTLRAWNVSSGELVREVPSVRGGAFALSPDGRLAAFRDTSGNYSGDKFKVYELKTGRVLFEHSFGANRLSALQFSRDGQALFCRPWRFSTKVHILDVQSGALLRRLSGHNSHIMAMAELGDGQTLVTSGADHSIRLWNWKSGELIQVLRGHQAEVEGLIAIPDGQSFVTASQDGQVLAWDPRHLSEKTVEIPLNIQEYDDHSYSFPHKRLRNPFWRFSPDSRAVYALEWQLLRRYSGRHFEHAETLIDFEGKLAAASFGSGRRHAATMDVEGNVAILKLDEERPRSRWVRRFENTEAVEFPGLSVANDRLVIHHQTNGKASLHVMRLSDSEEIHRIEMPKDEMIAAVSEDCRWVLTSEGLHNDKTVYDLSQPNGAPTKLSIPNGHFWGAAFAPLRDTVALSGEPNVTSLFRLSTGELTGQLRGQFVGSKGVFFSPDQRRIVTCSSGRDAIKLWDLETERSVLTLADEGEHWYVSEFSPDGNLIGTLSTRYVLRIWQAPTWEQIGEWEREAERSE